VTSSLDVFEAEMRVKSAPRLNTRKREKMWK